MTTARFKPATRYRNLVGAVKHRILCGKTDERGCHNCRGELGDLIAKAELWNGKRVGGPVLYLHPLVNPAMACDKVSGAYRLSRQRRPFRSGGEGSRSVGAGVAQTASAHLIHDAKGQPLKRLEHLYESDSHRHEHMVMVCPRCQEPNDVTFGEFVAYLERTYAPH